MAARAKPRGQKLARRQKKYDAFISHALEEAAWVEMFVSNLESLGLSIAHSHSLEFGKSYDEAAGAVLKDSGAMLLVVSPTACCSPRVRSDVERWKRTSTPEIKLVAVDLWGLRYPDERVVEPIRLVSYDVDSYRLQVLDLARQISGRDIVAPTWRDEEIPDPRGWPISAALSQSAVEIIRFFEVLKSLWEGFEKHRGITDPNRSWIVRNESARNDLESAYERLYGRGGPKSKRELYKVLDGFREDLEAAGRIVGQLGHRPSGAWWRDTYSELEEAIRVEEEEANERASPEDLKPNRRDVAMMEHNQARQLNDALRNERELLNERERERLAKHGYLADLRGDEPPPQVPGAPMAEGPQTLTVKLRESDSRVLVTEENLSVLEAKWPTNTPTWEELASGTPSYEVNPFEDVVLCMHPETERAWRDAVPNARTAELRCMKIQTPEGPWHREGKPDEGLWNRVFMDIRAKVQEARDMKAKRIHLVAMAPVSFGALLGSLLDPQNSRIVVYQPHNVQGQKDLKTWRSYGPEWSSSPGQRTEPFFERPPGLGVARPDNDSHLAVVVNITGRGDPEACAEVARAHAGGKTVHVVHVRARKTGQGAITVPADADRAAIELDKVLQQIAEDFPAATLHLFYYGPLAVLVRGACGLGLRRVPLIVYESMMYDDGWHWLPAIRFPGGRLLIGESQTGIGNWIGVPNVDTSQAQTPFPAAPAVGGGGAGVARSALSDPLTEADGGEKQEAVRLPTARRRVEVFIVCDPKDKRFRDRLVKTLVGEAHFWDPSLVTAGEPRDAVTRRHLDAADLVVVLISADLVVNNDAKKLIDQAGARRDGGRARIVPVLVRECNWEKAIPALDGVEALPPKGKCIRSPGKDELWKEVDDALRGIVLEIQAGMFGEKR